jgi:hypothetical protein
LSLLSKIASSTQRRKGRKERINGGKKISRARITFPHVHSALRGSRLLEVVSFLKAVEERSGLTRHSGKARAFGEFMILFSIILDKGDPKSKIQNRNIRVPVCSM